MRKLSKVLVVSAAIAAALISTAHADNLLQNPGFESWSGGVLDNWTNDSGITVEQCSDTVHGGNYSARITLTTQTQSNADFFSDEIAVVADSTYTFSIYIFDNDPAGKARLCVSWYDADHHRITTNYEIYSSNSNNWQLLSKEFTAPSNAAYAKAQLRFYDVDSTWDGDAVFYIDDASFEGPSLPPNQPPTISNITQTPENPTSSDDVTVTADISDPDGDNIAKDSLWYRVWHSGSWGNWTSVAHSSTDPHYTYTIPSQSNHDSVEYYIIAEDDNGNRTESTRYTYYVSDDPIISDITQVPVSPTSSDNVIVFAEITDPNNDLSTDSLYYSTDNGTNWTQVAKDSVGTNDPDIHYYTIPNQSDGTTVQYYIVAKDNAGNRTQSDTYSYTVSDIIPPVINEIMYDPSLSLGHDTLYEWVEIYNPNDEPYDVTSWEITDGEGGLTFGDVIIPPYGFLVVAKDTNSIRASSYYSDDIGSSNDLLVGNAEFYLSNSGDQVVLKDNNGETKDSVNYTPGWGAHGNGKSLELKDPSLDNNDGDNWQESTEEHGTPGEPNDAYNDNNCALNGDFESWGASGPTGWIVEDGATVSEDNTHRRRGSKSAKIENTTSGKGMVQGYDVQGNAPYELRVWLYPVGASDNLKVFLIFTDGSGSLVDSIGPLTVSDFDKWQLLQQSSTVNPGATHLDVKIRGYNTSKGVSGYVDDYYFYSGGATPVFENRPSSPRLRAFIRTIYSGNKIQFVVTNDRVTEIEIYAVDGRRVHVLRGFVRFTLPKAALPSGVYYAVARLGEGTFAKTKFVVVR